MKVKTYVELCEEIEVDVSKEDIVAMFHDYPDPGETWFPILNRFYMAMQALPDTVIAQMTPTQQHNMGEFLTTQAARFNRTN